jgi:tagatose-1,6-bisphosphate aldolase
VNKDIYMIEHIKNPSEEIQLKVIDVDAWLIQFINNPSEEVQKKVIEINTDFFELIKNPTDKVKNIYREMLNDELEYWKELITRKPDRINNDFYKNKLEKIIEKLKKLEEN